MVCKICGKQANSLRSVVRKRQIIEGCDSCLPQQIIQTDGHVAKFNRESQKKDYRKDLIQPWQKEYFRAYPEQARAEYGDTIARKYS